MNLSDDSIAILLLCSDLTTRNTQSEYRPYTVSQWNKLTEKLITLQKTPKDLFNIDVLAENLNIDKEEKDRIKWLISRKGNLAFAISQLVSQGINIVTRADKIYPKIYKTKLKKNTPPVIYYAGNLSLLEQDNIAVVGSRNVDEIGIDFTTEFVKKMCKENYNIVSGGARCVDSIAEQIALKNNGNIIIIVSDNMEKKIKDKEIRNAILHKKCVILSVVHPEEHFKNYNAMERNKYIYSAAKYSLVVSSDYKKGGTWTGAIENYKKSWSKLIVRDTKENLPLGNTKLLEMKNVIKLSEINNNISLKQYINSINYENPIIEEKIKQITLF